MQNSVINSLNYISYRVAYELNNNYLFDVLQFLQFIHTHIFIGKLDLTSVLNYCLHLCWV